MNERHEFQGFYIPERMMGGIKRYITHGIPPGSFLTAIICNNLTEAVARADDENMQNLPAYANYFYWEVPGNAWGSKEKMDAWMAWKERERLEI